MLLGGEEREGLVVVSCFLYSFFEGLRIGLLDRRQGEMGQLMVILLPVGSVSDCLECCIV